MGDVARRIGTVLRPVRAGAMWLACNRRVFRDIPAGIALTSPAFDEGGPIPLRFTADGAGASPPLRWEGLPDRTRSLLLLVEDPDAPFAAPFVHALALGIEPERTGLEDGALPVRMRVPGAFGLFMGRNFLGVSGWTPPSPPPGHGPHRYVFQLFALATDPRFDWPPGRGYALAQTWRHVIGRGMLTGIFERR